MTTLHHAATKPSASSDINGVVDFVRLNRRRISVTYLTALSVCAFLGTAYSLHDLATHANDHTASAVSAEIHTHVHR